MDELIVRAVSEVARSSREFYREFSRTHVVSKYRKQELKNALETYVSIRRGQNKARIFDNNMQILERCYRTIETMPPETLLYNATMRQFNILANYLEQLLEEYN